MQLTHDQEQNLLEYYKPMLSSVVGRFANRYCGVYKIDFEDCLQECAIVFLKHIRRVENEEQIRPLPYRDFLNVMCMQVLGALPASVPHRTTEFRRMITDVQDAGSLDNMIESGFDVSGDLSADYMAVDERLSFEQFLSELTEEDRQMIDGMMKHGVATKVGKELGLATSTVTRRLARLRSKYLDDCGGRVA